MRVYENFFSALEGQLLDKFSLKRACAPKELKGPLGRNIHRYEYLRLRCRDLPRINKFPQLLRTEVLGDPLNFDAKRDGVKHVRMNWRFRSSDQTLSTSPDLHMYIYTYWAAFMTRTPNKNH